jgi:hypothetical protein
MHTRVVQVHGGRCARVCGNIQNGEGRGLHRGLELYKSAQCQGRADHAGEVCKTTLERAREEEELGLGSKGWWEVLQPVYECNGLDGAELPRISHTVSLNQSQSSWIGCLRTAEARSLIMLTLNWS